MTSIRTLRPLLDKVNESNFDNIALEVFRFQAASNLLYQTFLHKRRIDPVRVNSIGEVPFLPISFFRSHLIQSGSWVPETTFRSSGTTGMVQSMHAIDSLDRYHEMATRHFETVFGSLTQYHILALLPSYADRSGSSLVDMVTHFIRISGSDLSGFHLHNQAAFLSAVKACRKQADRKILIIGVSFALLDLAEGSGIDLSDCLVMETGGMKGRRKEIVREELHAILCEKLNLRSVLSEYGMTELLSQAYATQPGLFRPAPTMKILLRELSDPLSQAATGRPGGINVIDLVNLHSIAFIETQDIGRFGQDGVFEVLGRIDNSDARGCNLLVEQSC
ncbi:MAG: acyl transferase [Cyclobacteriaceae bacterium]